MQTFLRKSFWRSLRRAIPSKTLAGGNGGGGLLTDSGVEKSSTSS